MCRWEDNIEMDAVGEVPLVWYGTWFAKEACFVITVMKFGLP